MRELGVDLNKVPGSGRKERIVVNDVQEYVQQSLQNGGGSGGLQIRQRLQLISRSLWTLKSKLGAEFKKYLGLFCTECGIPHVTQFDG